MRNLMLLAAVLVAAGCDKKVDTDGLEKTISERTDLGGTATRVDCPDDVKADKGAIFVCQVQIDGKKEYPLEVTIESVEGSKVNMITKWKDPLLSRAKLEEVLTPSVRSQTNDAVVVDCGDDADPLFPRPADGNVWCDISDGKEAAKIRVEVDEAFNVGKWEVAEKPVEAPTEALK
jgi:hypothetical protein